MVNAKVFWSGNSQAVRLPKGFRFPPGTEEVEIHRDGEALILKPPPRAEWPAGFWRAFEGMPEDFERPAQVTQRRDGFAP
jgi:antitoxin VapB